MSFDRLFDWMKPKEKREDLRSLCFSFFSLDSETGLSGTTGPFSNSCIAIVES